MKIYMIMTLLSLLGIVNTLFESWNLIDDQLNLTDERRPGILDTSVLQRLPSDLLHQSPTKQVFIESGWMITLNAG